MVTNDNKVLLEAESSEDAERDTTGAKMKIEIGKHMKAENDEMDVGVRQNTVRFLTQIQREDLRKGISEVTMKTSNCRCSGERRRN